jgi:NAD(P)-dependent dehydrogenase (short-subunit alcohol dehydrogenase family)
VRVVVHGRNQERTEATASAIRAGGGEAAVAIGDLSSDSEAAAVADNALAVFGGIDILVNNAGAREYATWEYHTPQRWLERINANAVGALRLCFKLIPGMCERRWGRLIQIGSIAGAMPGADYGDYSASKAVLLNMTTAMAQRFGPDGITSNIISIGMVRSESSQVLDRVVRQTGLDAEAAERKICTEMLKVPVGRFCTLEEVAHCAAFLAGPGAAYVNGTNLRLDGGMVPTMSL